MKKNIIGLLLAASFSTQLKAQSFQPFVDGDRVVLMGNSITEAGYYGSNIWLYYMTRFPTSKVAIINAGIGGDVVGQMNNRFETDVLTRNPNVVVLTFGMNDTGYHEFNDANAEEKAKQRVEKSFQGFSLLEAKLKAQPTIKTVIMSSSPYDETVKNKNNYFKNKSKAMEQIIGFQQAVAQKNQWAYVDLFHPITEINVKGQQVNPEFTITGPDRIHPGKAGHLVMAAIFLKSQGLAGKPVATVHINAKKGPVKLENAAVEINKRSDLGLSFSYLARALPFPIDSVSGVWENPQTQADALAIYPFIQDFNQETLKVENLKKGNYNLLIDGRKIQTFSSDMLEKGINMALLSNTPQYQQAVEVMHLNDLRLDLEKKLREYYWLQYNYFNGENLLFDDSQLALEKVLEKAKTDWFVRGKITTYQTARFPQVRKMWEDNIKQLTDRIYQINKPKSHLVEITAVK